MGTGSVNTIDQLLGHTAGPAEPVTDRDLTRARSSAYIVHGNYNELTQSCDDIRTGVIAANREAEKADVENEVYRRIHNHVSSLYSYNERIRDILNKRLQKHIGKKGRDESTGVAVLLGEVFRDAMRRQRVTESELRTAVRKKRFGSLEDVEAIVLESSGEFPVIGSFDDESAFGETLDEELGN